MVLTSEQLEQRLHCFPTMPWGQPDDHCRPRTTTGSRLQKEPWPFSSHTVKVLMHPLVPQPNEAGLQAMCPSQGQDALLASMRAPLWPSLMEKKQNAKPGA